MLSVAYRTHSCPAAAVAIDPRREMCRLVRLGLLLFAHEVSAQSNFGRIVNVQDGDTLTMLVDRRQVKVRLTEIDGP